MSSATAGSIRRACWLLPVAVHGALLWLYYRPEIRPLFGDEGMYLQAARSVMQEGTSGLGSFWPPAYAWLLAPFVALGDGSMWGVHAAQTALLVAAAWLLAALVERGLEDRWAGDLSRILLLSFPPVVAFAHYVWPEILHLTLMLAAATVLQRWGPRLWAAGLAGLLLAACLQTKALLLPFVPLLLAGLWFAWPRHQRAKALAALLIALGLGVLPTLVAQQRDFGRPMLADSGWFNLWVGLNEASDQEFVDSVVVEEYPRYRQSARSSDARARIVRDKIATLVAERGVVDTLARQLGRQYHRLFGRDSFLTHQLDGGALWRRGDGYRAGDSLLGRTVRWLAYGFWAMVLIGAAFGCALFPYRRRPIGVWILAFLAVQCGIFLLLHVKSRYRVQMLPGLIFFAAYAASWWRSRYQGRVSSRPWPRLAAGSGAALVLLWLAFGA